MKAVNFAFLRNYALVQIALNELKCLCGEFTFQHYLESVDHICEDQFVGIEMCLIFFPASAMI